MEYKATPFAQFKKDGLGPRTRAGVFAVLGNRDHGGDRIMPGAFAKTMAEQKGRVRFLWNHNFNSVPTARIDDLYEISQADLPEQVRAFAPDALGGAVVVRTYLDTKEGNDLLAALDADAVNEMSFAYDCIKEEFVTEGQGVDERRTRVIRELRLYEASDVLWGMNPATLATMSLPLESFAEQLRSLQAAIKSGARHSASDMKCIKAIHEACKSLHPGVCKPGDQDSADADADDMKNFDALTVLQESRALLAQMKLRAFA